MKNAVDLMDRLLKDIVAQHAVDYIDTSSQPSNQPDAASVNLRSSEVIPFPTADKEHSADVTAFPSMSPSRNNETVEATVRPRPFNLSHFIPLLRERLLVISPFTRTYLVSWIKVLDSIPDLDLISYLPEFLEGVFQFLADVNEDVRVSTSNLLQDFLDQIRTTAVAQNNRKLLQEERKRLNPDQQP